MEPDVAMQHLCPARAVLAVAAVSIRVGKPDRPFIRVLHQHVQQTHQGEDLSYAAILSSFASISFTVSNAHDISDDFPKLNDAHTVSDCVRTLVEYALTSEHALSSLLDLLAPGFNSEIARNSLVDLFLRKCYVAYASLSYAGLTILRERLTAYESGADEPNFPAPFPGPVASDTITALSTGVPAKSKHYQLLKNIHASAEKLNAADAEYALHLEAVRRKDAATADVLLHRAFDLSLRTPIPEDNSTKVVDALLLPRRLREQQKQAAPPRSEQAQYAALAHATANARLGSLGAARRALDDAMRIAQHAGDAHCQALTLEWLVNLTRRRELQRCPVAIAATSLRNRRADDPPLDLSPLRGDMRPKALLVNAAAWEQHAALPSALAAAKAALASARMKRTMEEKFGSDDTALMSSDEARALVAVAKLTAKAKSPTDGIKLLDEELVGRERPDVHKDFSDHRATDFPELDILRRGRAWLAFNRAAVRLDIHAAELHLRDVEAWTLATDGEGVLDAAESRARLALAREEYDSVAQHAHSYRRFAAAINVPGRSAEGALLLARAYLDAGDGSRALPLALGAQSLAEALGMEEQRVQAAVYVAWATFALGGDVVSAEKSLAAVMPRAVGGMGVAMRGLARRVHAQLLLKMYENNQEHDKLRRAAVALEDGAKAYRSAEDLAGVRDCSYLLAKVCNKLGDIKNRDGAAKKYRVCIEAQNRLQGSYKSSA